MNRKPIIIRNPIVHRTAIYHRRACFSSPVKYENCRLCRNFTDCSGISFVDWKSKESLDKYRLIYIPVNYDNWGLLDNQIHDLYNQGAHIRLILNREIPKEILWAFSYSEKNILQVNINMLRMKKDMTWVQKLMSLAGNCGVYCLVFLYPIIPDIVKTYHVIDILDRLKNTVQFHSMLKFFRTHSELKEPIDEYLNFNGVPISMKYLIHNKGVWECSEEYQNRFLDLVNIYAEPRKLSVSICGKCKNCTGLGGNYHETSS